MFIPLAPDSPGSSMGIMYKIDVLVASVPLFAVSEAKAHACCGFQGPNHGFGGLLVVKS